MKEKLINAAILFVAGLMFFLLLSITGCATTYEYTSGDTSFKVRSYREFKKIRAEYNGLIIVASGVTDDTAEVVIGVSDSVMEDLAWYLKAQADPTSVLGNK